MCQDCIISHLRRVIIGASETLVQHQEIRVTLEPIKSCTPFKVKKTASTRYSRCVLLFPGKGCSKGPVQAKRTAVILRVISIILGNLTAGKTATIRDIYYQDVGLFRNQDTVVRAIEQLSRYWRVPRDQLQIVPSPNGLVAADLTIALESGELLEVSRANGPSLIPVGAIKHVSTRRAPKFILVVEKEAVFTHLQTELQNGIVITGRGFPDHATRRLVRALTVTWPHVPVWGLVDSDVHGMLILRAYECGSEKSVEIQDTISSLTYLGVSILEYSEGLVDSTVNDKRVAMSTLTKEWIHLPKYRAWRTELQRGLFMGKKGEMNLLDMNQSHRLSKYVLEKMYDTRTSQPAPLTRI